LNVIPFDFTHRAGARLHEPFLERASEAGSRFRAHALGAFLTLRAIDRVAEGSPAGQGDALTFQLRAAVNYLDELHPQNEEVSHLREIIRVAELVLARGNRQTLWAPMLAFAYWLEQELRLDEALDVLDTMGRATGEAGFEERIAGHLQRGRVLRLASRFPEATAAYATAGEMANLSGDWRSEMVSRIGRAAVLQKTGDLPRAERELVAVMNAARERGDAFVEARASHDLAVSANLMNRTAEAASLAFKAFELYEEPAQRSRALGDTGTFLKDLGHYSAAREAFLTVLESGNPPEIRTNTLLELLELSSLVQDRVGFARWLRELDEVQEQLPPHERVDLEIKVGAGLAGFGQMREGMEHLARGVSLAEEFKLGPQLFLAETLLAEITAGKAKPVASPPQPSSTDNVEFQSTIDGVFALRAT